MQYRPDIDGLRALSVVSVVLFHAFPHRVPGGFIGVDIFFVISGYLISGIIFRQLSQGVFSISGFFGRRIVRIFPALLAVILSVVVFGWFVLFSGEYAQLAKHIAASSVFLLNFVLVLESGYFDNLAETKPLLHLWSLAVEEQFYIIWPVVLLLMWRLRKVRIWILVLIAVLSMMANLVLVSRYPTEMFFWPVARFWEFIAGGLLAWSFFVQGGMHGNQPSTIKLGDSAALSQKVFGGLSRIPGGLLCLIGISLLIVGIFALHGELGYPGIWACIPVLGAVMVIGAGSDNRLSQLLLMNPVAVWLGLISYPLYLWHWPLFSFLRIVNGETPAWHLRVAAIFASVLLAWLTYKFIETPIRKRGRYRTTIVTLLIAMAGFGFGGVVLKLQEGVPERSTVSSYQENMNELSRTRSVDPKCQQVLNIENRVFDYCRIENSGSENMIAVIGDSHAHAAFDGISKGLRKVGFGTILLANSSCPPFLGSPWGHNEVERMNCSKRIEQVLSSAVSVRNLDTVIMFSRGPVYWTGIEPSLDKRIAPSLDIDSYFDGLQRTVDFLGSRGIDVVYVTENPELGMNSRDCLGRPLDLKESVDCRLPISSVNERQKEYLQRLSLIQSMDVVSSLSAFCDPEDGMCSPFDADGRLLYADADHISVSGSRVQFDRVIAPYLKSRNRIP